MIHMQISVAFLQETDNFRNTMAVRHAPTRYHESREVSTGKLLGAVHLCAFSCVLRPFRCVGTNSRLLCAGSRSALCARRAWLSAMEAALESGVSL